MASSNVLGVQDAYALINAISAQSVGATGLTATDTSSFVKVAEAIMQTGLESTMNAIGYVLGRTIFSIRPYKSKLASLERDPERFGMITRKITYLMKGASKSNNWNTQIDSTQLEDGASVDPFVINAPKAVQLCIPGAETLQTDYTVFKDQLRLAFSNESEFIRFWETVALHVMNMIELQKESKGRVVLANFIAAKVAMEAGQQGVRDLVYDFNVAFGTSYTREQLLSTYASDFWKFVAATIKNDSELLSDMTAYHHEHLTGYDPIIRHTPKDRQKLVVYGPAFNAEKAYVFSTLFNPQYLDIATTEEVTHWQAKDYPASIDITPSILNTTTGEANAAGAAVSIPYVLGVLFDEEALGIMPKFDSAGSIYNPYGEYTNMVWHWLYKSYCDYTENGIVYVLGDLPTADGPRLQVLSGGAGSNLFGGALTPVFNSETFSYTATNSSGSGYVNAAVKTGSTLKSLTLNGVEIPNYASATLAAGENTFIATVSKPGYADVTYTVVITNTAGAKNGDDDAEGDPEEEPIKATKSTKSTK